MEPKIVFMGTPEFAVASLAKLVESGCNLVGVVTAADKPAGRGMQLQQSPVKQYAISKNIPVLQPEKLKDPVFLDQLKSLNADLQVVVAFRMLPELVWNMPPMGTINLHGSLLPQYRGAAPINRAIMNGEKETGVTTFKLKHEIDTGDILLTERIPIHETETAGELHDVMKEVGASLLLKTILGLTDGNLTETPQSSFPASALRNAPKLFTEDCKIDWNKKGIEIYNQVRGLSPFPGAFTSLDGKQLKIYKATLISQPPSIVPGNYETDQKTYFQFACMDGYLSVLELQLEGKKKMTITDFLRGYRFTS